MKSVKNCDYAPLIIKNNNLKVFQNQTPSNFIYLRASEKHFEKNKGTLQ